MSPRSMSNARISQTACSWRRRSRRTMDTRNNKVIVEYKDLVAKADGWYRYPYSMDRVEWNRHGVKLSRSGRLRGHLVSCSTK